MIGPLVFSVNLINMTQQNANNNNNNNNNNNENMNMNMNMNSKKRSLSGAPYVAISNVGGNLYHREKRWDHIFNLVEFPKGEII